jgi:M6 family metalloprotease-like protein
MAKQLKRSNPRVAMFLMMLFAAAATTLHAAYLRDVKQELRQPDGTVVNCLASGDEYFNFWHDADGFVIIRDPQGWLTYAVKVGDELLPSSLIVGHSDPQTAGLKPWVRPGQSVMQAAWERINPPSKVHALGAHAAPGFTQINNPVFFVLFQDEDYSIFSHSSSQYDTLYNSTATGANSMRNYFKDVSYQQLTLASTVANAAYKDANPRSYYQPYNATTNPNGYQDDNEAAKREHTLLGNVVTAYVNGGYIPAGLNVDTNNDGNVDNVTFIISGTPGGWSDLIWPHRWFMSAGYPVTVTINGKKVDAYNFNVDSEVWNTSRGVGVLCHEMTHTLGAPDLYHYREETQNLAPVGPWDIMENTTNPPQHAGAYMKLRYLGWINSIPTITSSGTYTLNPLTSATNNAYKIASPNSSSEYFVVEYRQKAGYFESTIPGTGLLVYRINTTVSDGSGNRNGPPDEIYIYRPGGSPSANGDLNQAHFSADTGRTAINDSTNPSSYLNDGSPGGLNISQVGSAGSTISFHVTVGGGSSCTYSLSSSSASIGSSGGAGSVGVTTQSGCTWTAAANAAWLTITGGASGTGSGTVNYTAGANSSSARTGTLTIAGQTFTVNQAGSGGGGSYVYWVETAAKTSGVGTSNWRTDVGVLNLGSGTATVYFQVFAGSNPTGHATLPAGAQAIYPDIVGQLSITGTGALKVTSDQPVIVTSRTYNDQGAFGTYGQYYDGYATGTMLSAGAVVRLAQLTENSWYRTNIAVTNTGSGSAQVRVTLYDSNGTQLTQFTLSPTSAQRLQENQVFKNRAGQTNLSQCYAKIEVLSGNGIIVSASVIDTTTGDPTTIPPKS